ncbi:MAG: mechanosensitive ion channel family protein [Candidatus Peregrinibacteria bacterium]|nr:mechanosensitive ion channel family protein [Candidatus Peregrinibacteria bacterium]MDZ4244321.1 mechanosensitive ion channel family protein [Candidatus Gracilibacteria bacterium]
MLEALFTYFIPTAFAQAASARTTANETTSGLQEFVTTLVDRAPFWVAGIIVMVFSIIVAKLVKNLVTNKVAAKLDDDHQDVLVLVGRTTYVSVLTLGIMIGMKIAGFDLTALVAAVGFGLGFALQGIITNFIAGVLVLLSRHFTIGDYIEIEGTIGKIVEIQSRATVLQALDGTRIIIPNADLFSKKVVSFTSNPFRRLEIIVGVEYSTPLAKACQVCFASMLQIEGVLKEPTPSVLVDEFSNSSINLRLWFWVDSRSNWRHTRSEVARVLKMNFDKVGISIPFPIRTVYQPDVEKVEAERSQLMESNFGEFDKIHPNETVQVPIKEDGEEKIGSEFLDEHRM